MLARFAGAVITGPVAFLAAGVYDFCAFFAAFARHSLAVRLRRARRRLPGGPLARRRPG
jgi:hypothetical protein